MDPTAEQIEDHIQHQRAALNSNIDELEQKVKAATDWRQQFRKSPGLFLAAAAGGGLVLALLTRRPRQTWVTDPAPGSVARPGRTSPFEKPMSVITSALMVVAANQAKSVLSRFIPEFRQKDEDERPAGPTRAASSRPTYRADSSAHSD